MITTGKSIEENRTPIPGSPEGGRPIRNMIAGQGERAMSVISFQRKNGKGHLLGDEGGFVLVLSMVIFFTLTLLGLTSLMNSNIEIQISGNENAGNLSLYSAEAGLNHALTLLNTNSGVVDYGNPLTWYYYYPDDDNDTSSFDNIDHGLGNDSRYRWSMHFKPDLEDLDNDSDTNERVFFNQHFGFPGSMYVNDGEGYPVIEIVSEGKWGTGNPSERRLGLDLGRNKYNVRVYGSVTAKSDVNTTGNINVDGRNHDINGNPGGSCGENLPGVVVDPGKVVTKTGSAAIAGGDDGTEEWREIDPITESIPFTPWGILGIDEGDMPAVTNPAAAPDPTSGFVYVGGDYELQVGGTGILVIHNPDFDAEIWDVSNPTSANYDTGHALYNAEHDSSHASYDAGHEPAVFSANSNGTFKGLIIADMVSHINGTITFIGAIVSLSTVEASHFGNGTADILYSCEALAQFTDQGYTTQLVWRRL